MTTADIEREKALKAQNSNEVLNTQTQDPLRFGEGGEETSGNYELREPEVKPTFKEKAKNFFNNAKQKGTDWKEKAIAETLQKNANPEQRYDLAGSTLENASQEGLAANRALQNTEIPKWKRATIKDVLFDPAYEGIRDSLASQAINARSANFMKGLAGKEGGYESAIDKYNKEQAARYSADVANRDTTATQAQLDAINAANKRDVGELLQRADFDVEKELERKGLKYDTETKKQILNTMITDSEEFAKRVPDPEDRLMLTAYQQYLSGDATALDSIITTYGTQALDKISNLVNKYLGGSDEEDVMPGTNIGGKDWTYDELFTMGADGIDRLLKDLPLDEQNRVLTEMESKYGTKGDMKEVRKRYDQRANIKTKTDEYNDNLINETDQRADTLSSDIDEITGGNYNEKQKVSKLQDLKKQLENDEKMGLVGSSDKLKTAKEKLNAEIAKAQLASEVTSINKPLQKNVKLTLDKNGDLNKKDAASSLAYLESLKWNSLINENTPSVTDRKMKVGAVMNTTGYNDVVNFLANPKVQAYAYKEGASAYKNAVNNFCSMFGGKPSDYGFLNVTW